jgi:hypothetical protein
MSLRLAGQGVLWLAIAALLGVFAQWPRFAPLPAGHGELKLSLAHLTERMQPCHTLSAEERQALPPNMRMLERCERARAPAVIELTLDGEVLLAEAIRPAGLHRDGRAYLYRHWALPAGDYALELALRDSPREEGFDRRQRFELTIVPGASALLKVGDGEAVLQDYQGTRGVDAAAGAGGGPQRDEQRRVQLGDPSAAMSLRAAAPGSAELHSAAFLRPSTAAAEREPLSES